MHARTIAMEIRLPTFFLVASAGGYLPMQDEIFPDQDDFGRVFYLNARMSAAGIPQLAAIMGNCVAGGAYLPVMCDTLVMTEGSGLYLAGRSEEHTSELQSRGHLVCRLLLEKKKQAIQ